MDADLEPVYGKVMNAARPEDMFNEMTVLLPQRLLIEHLSEEVKQCRTILDVARYSHPDDVAAARTALERFEYLYKEAAKKAASGLYALDGFSRVPVSERGRKIVVDGVTYMLGAQVHIGEHSSLYEAHFSYDGGSVKAIVRVAHTCDDNLYLNNEIRILDRLHRKVDDKDLGYWRYLPFVFGRFSAGRRIGIVYRWFEGITATNVRMNSLHKDGLDQRHVIWIYDRMINLLGYVHARGVIHGRIDPDRLWVRPSNHNVMLTGWNQAVYKPVITGERMSPQVLTPFVAPEVNKTGEVGPWTDIYSLGKCMIWLLGGNPATNMIPDSVHEKVQRFFLSTVRENPRARPQDAWQLYKAQNRLKDSLWERRFIHLDLV